MLEIRNISKVYKLNNKKIFALNDLNLEIKDGEIVCFLGPNGAGKTTSIKILGTFILPTTGEFFLDGISGENKRKYIEKIGVLFEGNRSIVRLLTPVENMLYFCGLRGISKDKARDRVYRYIKELDLDKYKDTQANYLSKGNQQKVAIGSMLSLDVKLFLLDEPTLGLDLEISNKVMNLFKKEAKEQNKIFIITTHDSEFVEDVADRIVVLKKGSAVFIGETKKFMEQIGCARLRDAYLKFLEEK